MPRQRRASADYLRIIFERPVKLREVLAHFGAFTNSLLRFLRIAQGQPLQMRLAEGEEADFEALARRQGPVLYGTFHFGDGDLLGYFLSDFGHQVRMVRLKVGNSDETRWMEEQFGSSVGFIWVDQPENMLFALRQAIEEGHSLAIKCDRIEGARKTEVFTFLGRERSFPFTIYWLSLLFDVPVVFSFGLQTSEGTTDVYSVPSFHPVASLSRAENLARARAHFETVLRLAERLVRENPYLWFNFEDWNASSREGAR